MQGLSPAEFHEFATNTCGFLNTSSGGCITLFGALRGGFQLNMPFAKVDITTSRKEHHCGS